MARIDWAILCDSAFLDRQDRLCVIGIIRNIPAAHLPGLLASVTLVARLKDIRQIDEVAVAVGVVLPGGQREARMGSENILIEMAGEFVLAPLRDIPLLEEGLYHFQVQLRGQPVVSVDVPVLSTVSAKYAEVQ